MGDSMLPLECFRPKLYQIGLPMSFDPEEKVGKLLKLSDLAQGILGDPDRLPWKGYKRKVSSFDAVPTLLRSYGAARTLQYDDVHGFSSLIQCLGMSE